MAYNLGNKLTYSAKKPGEECVFKGGDFSGYGHIEFIGFEKVAFSQFRTVFEQNVKICITKCKEVRFDEMSFASKPDLCIEKAEAVNFYDLQDTSGIKLSTQGCERVTYVSSSLNFDMGNVKAKHLRLEGVQIAGIKHLNLTGISESLTLDAVMILKDLTELSVLEGLNVINLCRNHGPIDINTVIRYIPKNVKNR